MDKGNVAAGSIFIVLGLVTLLHRGYRDWAGREFAANQRGWARLLPWLRRSTWLQTDEAGRAINGGVSVFFILMGLGILAGLFD